MNNNLQRSLINETLNQSFINNKCGCNCSFMTEKESFIEWMAATGMVN